ncbi:MAG: hypothetical protein PHO31_00390 [Candidatus Pacebacteria bacterium]|nr:hypothetical protein [Candidatus Paceibacterota bacterium]
MRKSKKIISSLFFFVGLITMSLFFGIEVGFSNPDPDWCIKNFEKLQNELNNCKTDCSKFEEINQRTKCLQNSITCSKTIEQKISSLYDECSSEFQKKIEFHQKEEQSLKNAIYYLDLQIENLDLEIRVKQEEINYIRLDIQVVENEINLTQGKIEGLENNIKQTKEKMANVLKALYQYDKENIVKVTLNEGKLSKIVDEITYLENLQSELANKLKELKEFREDLENKKKELNQKREDLKQKEAEVLEKKASLDSRMADLNSLKSYREDLLTITQGKEEEYQRILDNLRQMKAQLIGDLNRYAQACSAEIQKIIQSTGVSKNTCQALGYQWIYQCDSRWANERLSYNAVFSSLPICQYFPTSANCMPTICQAGCAVSSVAMIAKTSPLVLAKDPTLNTGWFNWNDPNLSKYGLTVPPKIIRGTDLNLDNYFTGRPQILCLKKRGTQEPMHFITLIAKINNIFIVDDPGWSGGECVPLEATKAVLANAFKTTPDNIVITQIIEY